MATGSLKDTAKLIKSACATSPAPRSLPHDTQSAIDAFLERSKSIDEHDSQRLQDELLSIYSAHVAKDADKTSVFLHALQLLRPAITSQARLEEWWRLAVSPVVDAIGRKRDEIDHASEFLYAVLDYDAEVDADGKKVKESSRFTNLLLDLYLRRTKIAVEDVDSKTLENEFVARQLENILVTFGRKKPKDLLVAIDGVIVKREHRMQALRLLSGFVYHQPPHLHLVSQTPLIEHLLKCLMIDTSTTALSIALKTFLMFLPHIPSSVMTHLPRLFLIYSRLLCWEKYSPAAMHEAKVAVQDMEKHSEDQQLEQEPEDESWEKLTSSFDGAESTAPELMRYFTFLYGLYPLNFTSFIRKPRKYLKNIEFPRADEFDLDQNVIRTRTEQFRQQHRLHPNFYNTTVEDELKDNRWLKSDPAEVVAECTDLFLAMPLINYDRLGPPGPPPTAKLPDVHGDRIHTDDIPSQNLQSQHEGHPIPLSIDVRGTTIAIKSTEERPHDANGDSPTLPPVAEPMSPLPQRQDSATSFRSVTERSVSIEQFPMPARGKAIPWRSPALRPAPPGEASRAFLQREILLLRNDLNFERYLKNQHLSHIGSLQRRQIKDATVEAETQNLLNHNRALKAKLAKADETNASLKKETATGRTQSKKFESELSSRVRSLRAEEKRWHADEEMLKLEVKKLTSDYDHLRRLVVESEARELLSQQKVTSMQLELEQVDNLRNRIQELEEKLKDFEAKEVQFDRTNDEAETLRTELSTANLKLQSRDAGIERQQYAYDQRIAELETKLQTTLNPKSVSNANELAFLSPSQLAPTVQVLIDNAVASANNKYISLRKEHTALRHRFVELEARCQELEEDTTNAYTRNSTGLGINPAQTRQHASNSSWRPEEVSSAFTGIPEAGPNLKPLAETNGTASYSTTQLNDLHNLEEFLPARSPLASTFDAPTANKPPSTISSSANSGMNAASPPPRAVATPTYDRDVLEDDMNDEDNDLEILSSPTPSVPSSIRHAPPKAAKLLGDPSLMGGGSGSGSKRMSEERQIYQRSDSAFSVDSLDGDKSKGMFGRMRAKGSGKEKEKDTAKDKDSPKSKGSSWFRGL